MVISNNHQIKGFPPASPLFWQDKFCKVGNQFLRPQRPLPDTVYKIIGGGGVALSAIYWRPTVYQALQVQRWQSLSSRSQTCDPNTIIPSCSKALNIKQIHNLTSTSSLWLFLWSVLLWHSVKLDYVAKMCVWRGGHYCTAFTLLNLIFSISKGLEKTTFIMLFWN